MSLSGLRIGLVVVALEPIVIYFTISGGSCDTAKTRLFDVDPTVVMRTMSVFIRLTAALAVIYFPPTTTSGLKSKINSKETARELRAPASHGGTGSMGFLNRNRILNILLTPNGEYEVGCGTMRNEHQHNVMDYHCSDRHTQHRPEVVGRFTDVRWVPKRTPIWLPCIITPIVIVAVHMPSCWHGPPAPMPSSTGWSQLQQTSSRPRVPTLGRHTGRPYRRHQGTSEEAEVWHHLHVKATRKQRSWPWE